MNKFPKWLSWINEFSIIWTTVIQGNFTIHETIWGICDKLASYLMNIKNIDDPTD